MKFKMKELADASTRFHMVLWEVSVCVTLLVIMMIITALLCVLVNQGTSQTDDILPAKILAQQKTVGENSDFYVTCSTFGLKRSSEVYVYLCKDDLGIRMQKQKPDQTDTIFPIFNVGLNYSGDYSCVYSKTNHNFSSVGKGGFNVIQIMVIANLLSADISVAGSSVVSEGGDVKLKCAVSHALQTLGKCKLIYSYLMRNQKILQVQAFNVTEKEATFTIKDAMVRDSGNYSCAVLPSKCIQEREETPFGNNAVLLEVKGSLFLPVIYSCGMLTLMLLLCLCLYLWSINKQHQTTALHSPCVTCQQANTIMLEEHQGQTEDLEAQDGDSFSIEEEEEEEEEYQKHTDVQSAEYSTYSDGSEDVYANPDESKNDYDTIEQMCAK